MTRQAVSFEKAFHFWELKISFTEMFHEGLQNSLIGIWCWGWNQQN